MREIKSIDKWDSLGFLKGLKGKIRDDITQLYESEPSHLLNEIPKHLKDGYIPLAVKNMEEAIRIKMEKRGIILNKIYHLDLGSSCPVSVRPISLIDENNILCEYLYSYEGRKESLPISLF